MNAPTTIRDAVRSAMTIHDDADFWLNHLAPGPFADGLWRNRTAHDSAAADAHAMYSEQRHRAAFGTPAARAFLFEVWPA